jgi:hypothetical protein
MSRSLSAFAASERENRIVAVFALAFLEKRKQCRQLREKYGVSIGTGFMEPSFR